MLPIKITVCGFAELEQYCNASVSRVLSILAPDLPAPAELGSLGDQRLAFL
jgi:hypothetical protein